MVCLVWGGGAVTRSYVIASSWGELGREDVNELEEGENESRSHGRRHMEFYSPHTGGSGGSEPIAGSGGSPTLELRGQKKVAWTPPSSWITYCRMVPFVCLLMVICMAQAAKGVE